MPAARVDDASHEWVEVAVSGSVCVKSMPMLQRDGEEAARKEEEEE